MIEGHDYTIYSNGPSGRARMYALLALVTAFLTPLAQHGFLVLLRRYWGDDWDLAEMALFFGGFTALVLFGILINVFDSYLWRTPLGEHRSQRIGQPGHQTVLHGDIQVVSATGFAPAQQCHEYAR